MENAEGYLKGKAGKKPIGTVAREAVQKVEDARIITIKKICEEQLKAERQAGVDWESRAETDGPSRKRKRIASLGKRRPNGSALRPRPTA